MITADLTSVLALDQGSYEVVPYRRTEKARLKTDDGFVRAVIPASRRLDMRKVRHALSGGVYPRSGHRGGACRGLSDVRAGSGSAVRRPAGDSVLVDRWPATHEYVVVEAVSHTASIRMKVIDLLAVADAEFRNLVVG
jgi:prolyl-tRNA editing enzyme YbaK/EbsC (Cys-tRNA(Pro) deacylase)